MTELDKVLAQGMNAKKKHEIEALAGVISLVAQGVEADTIVDVGAGQGYLSQVLSFQHQHSVYAIDASSHHGRVTDARAERIRKHYAANIRKSRSKERDLRIPQTVTCRVLSANMLKNLSDSILKKDHNSLNRPRESIVEEPQTASCPSSGSSCNSTLVLAGLHACGDLSVTMLRTFLECEEVKAVVSIGCCYNLISEEDHGVVDHHCGFPLSRDLKQSRF
ncbi:hypothetical protein Leryth_014378 [Lithospermum erythrorhizon]|nr:hypothetical protein Leryth_014378 [Lithospermum erythrorhizon]